MSSDRGEEQALSSDSNSTNRNHPTVDHPLGRVWQAEEAVDAWCQKDLRSFDVVQETIGNFLPLVLCNYNEQGVSLICAYVTAQGDLDEVQVIPPTRQRTTTTKMVGTTTLEGDTDDADPRGSASTRMNPQEQQRHESHGQRPVVEHTYYGYAYVFGRLANPHNTKKLTEVKHITDLIIVGAFRPEKRQTRTIPEFPCHIIKLVQQPANTVPLPHETPLCPNGASKSKSSSKSSSSSSLVLHPKLATAAANPQEFLFGWDRSWTVSVEERTATDNDNLLELGTQWYAEQAVQAWLHGQLLSVEEEEEENEEEEEEEKDHKDSSHATGAGEKKESDHKSMQEDGGIAAAKLKEEKDDGAKDTSVSSKINIGENHGVSNTTAVEDSQESQKEEEPRDANDGGGNDDDADDDDDESSVDQDEILRLWFCNYSSEPLVYAWIDTNGTLADCYLLPNKPDSGTEGDEDEESEQAQNTVFVKSVVGHAFVFGKLKKQEGEQSPSQNTSNSNKKLEHVKDLSDMVVVGAYRPERFSAYWEEDDEHDFPCHVVALYPPSLGEAEQKSTRTTFLQSKRQSQQPQEAMVLPCDENTTENTHEACVKYEYDSSWTMKVEEVMKMQDLDLIDTTTKQYELVSICDWPVYLEPECFATLEQRQLFESDLQYALDHIPEHARTCVKTVPSYIWINKSFQYGPSATPYICQYLVYHVEEPDYFEEYKLNPAKQNCVEIFDYNDYFVYTRPLFGPGGLLIHELTHAYHDLVIGDGEGNDLIRDSYQKAMQEGLYDQVPRRTLNGQEKARGRAYACTNYSEYFAELSSAFLGGLDPNQDYNKWFPHCRAQIKEHDPRGYAMLHKLWKIPYSTSLPVVLAITNGNHSGGNEDGQ
ncbi:hypothetical protein ACA910_010464 [Epithemia clementina (nom. ined.)]